MSHVRVLQISDVRKALSALESESSKEQFLTALKTIIKITEVTVRVCFCLVPSLLACFFAWQFVLGFVLVSLVFGFSVSIARKRLADVVAPCLVVIRTYGSFLVSQDLTVGFFVCAF